MDANRSRTASRALAGMNAEWSVGVNDIDRESDGIEDEALCRTGGGDAALDWANEGS